MYQTDNDLRRYFDNNPGRLLDKWLHYFEVYDHHFSRYRGKPVNILEIGVFNGGSIQLWKEYFGPQARIYCVDIDPRCKQFEEENVRIFIGDQADRDFLQQLRKDLPRPDILIDDGGHLMHQQIATFEELYPFVAEDGIYLCEDMHTSYWPEWGGGTRKPGTFIEYSKRLIDSLNGFYSNAPDRFSPSSITRSAHSLHFYDSMLVIEKRARASMPKNVHSGKRIFEPDSIGSWPIPLQNFAVLTSDARGASRIEERLFIPNTLEKSRFTLVYGGWKQNNLFKYTDELIHKADGYVVHGQFPEFFSSDVLDHIFATGKPVIYFFDESFPELSGNDPRTRSGFRHYLTECLKLAHLVVVENEAQKNAYQELNNRILVLPPKLDPKRYTCVPPYEDGVLRVIYRGGEGHLEDLMLVAEAVRASADRHPGKLEFHFFGRGLAALGQHPAFHFHANPPTLEDWDKCIQDIRPALALMPLRNRPERSLASALPLLEYAAYGIPVIASKVAPYHGLVKDGLSGLLAANTTEAWLAALESLLTTPGSLKALQQTARNWLENEHALNGGNSGLAGVFEQAANIADAAKSAKPATDFRKLDKQPLYQKYLIAQQLAERDVRWMEHEFGQWPHHPVFHLLITLIPAQTPWLQQTLDSLATQIYPHWKLSIIAFTPVPDDMILDERVEWYEVGDDEDSYDALNRFARQPGTDWVGFIEAGDILHRQAFFKYAFHARRNPKWRILYADEDQITSDLYRSNPLFKPDFNPDLLRAYPYTGSFCLFERKLYEQLGGVDGEKDGAEVYDLLLRGAEKVASEDIGHLAEILYSRFASGGHSIRSPKEIWQSSMDSLRSHFARSGIRAEVNPGPYTGTMQVEYALADTPLVSIIIPTRDHLELIKPCLDSLLAKTDYPNYEILVVNNGSRDEEVLDYFQEMGKHPKIRILDYPHPFNFSAICNFGAQQADGKLLLLLNNDTEIVQPQWLSEMVRHALRPEVAVVGACLLTPNEALQHAGVIVGLTGVADHPFLGASPGQPGYMMRTQFAQNYSAVTGACMLVRKDVYLQAGGMDETDLKVLYNDIDLCLRIRERGHLIVWTPRARLIHKTSISIEETLKDGAHKQYSQSYAEHHTMFRRWLKWIAFDPAYNRNLTHESNQFGIEADTALGWDPAWRPATRILAFPGDLEGCGEYRLIAPCRALNQAGLAQAHVSHKLYYPGQFAKIDPDVVILQRQVENDHLDTIGEIKRYSKAFRVFEIDDLLHDLPASSVHRNVMHGDELERLVEGISLCDRFVTTSPVLADVYGRYCQDVRIVPNFLERAKWGQFCPARLQRKKPRVGWAGGASHTGDLLLLHAVIKALHKEVDWVFFGMCPESLRPFICEFHGPVKLEAYPAKLASLNLDLALAPLEYHPFNEAKSALKVLEYGILGYPVICTDIVTYQGDFPVTRVSNNPQEWIDAIRHAIDDRDRLACHGDALREHIQNHWMLEDNLDKWLAGWLP